MTGGQGILNIPRLMSADVPNVPVPEVVDASRMVASRRGVEGRVPLASFPRLRDSLADTEGEVVYSLDFGTDEFKVPFVELRVSTELPLQCQRSLDRFLFPVTIEQRLGLIRDEADEAALPPDYEALLMPEDGMLKPIELVEDELILAVPVIPVKPGTEAMERDWPADEAEVERANPFAALSALKNKPGASK